MPIFQYLFNNNVSKIKYKVYFADYDGPIIKSLLLLFIWFSPRYFIKILLNIIACLWT